MKIKRDLIQFFLLGVMLLPVSVWAQFQWVERVASITNLPDDGPNGGITLDSQDNCYVTGFFDGTNNFGGVTLTNDNGGGQDIFVAKYSSTGALQWAQRAGGSSSNSDEGRGIGVDNNGNIYVAGGFYGPANFGSINLPATDAGEFFLAKYNNAGAIQWVRQSVGGSFAEGTGLAVDGAGNSYVLGYAANGATYTFGSTNLAMPNNLSEGAFLIKYDNTGAVQWAQVLGGSDEVYATKVAVDAAGNVYVRGTFYSTLTIGSSNLVVSAGSTKNMFIAKFDNSGTLIWVQQPIGGDVDEGGVAVDPAGNVFVTGYFDANLNFGDGITLTNTANDNAPFGDAFVAKYNSFGAIQWAQPAGGTNGGFYWDVALDAQTNVYPAGFLGSDAAIAKYNSAGILQWTESANGLPASPVASTVSKCAVDAAGNCYLAGWYQGTNTFGTNTLQPQEAWNFFLAEVGPSNTVASSGSNLVQNGGFETGDFTGWTPSGDTSYTFVDDGSESGITPYSGSYEAALGTSGSLGYLSQTLTTVSSQSYLVSVWLNSPDGETPNEFLVSWNGNTIFDQVNMPALGWTNLQFTVTAAGTSTVLQFGFRDDPSFLGLDDVSVMTSQSGPLTVATTTLSNGTNGFAYSQQLSAVNGQTPYAWTIISGALPSGVTLGANGLISGTPTTVVTTNFTVQVKDATNGIATQSLSLTIQAPAPLQILTTSLPNGTNGVAYSQVLTATGGHTPYNWTAISGALPPGLTLTTNGMISGIPTTGGTFNFAAQVTDELSATVTLSLALTVGDPPSVALQPTNNSVSVPAGSSVDFAVSVTGTGPFSYHWQLNGTNLLGSIINTVAGGYIGDGVAATNASLSSPLGLAVDATGNLFIADSYNNRIRRIGTNGIITTVVGNGSQGYSGDGGPATNAELNGPFSVAVDAAGNLFIGDSGNNVIRMVSTNGIITTVAGGGSPTYPGIGDMGPATNAILNSPQGVAVDASGNLFIADTYFNRIRKVGTNGIITTVAGNGNYGSPGGGGPATNAILDFPLGVAVDASGNLFIAADGDLILRVGTNGIIATMAGGGPNYPGDGGSATNARMGRLTEVAVDASGNLFIADSGYSLVSKVDTNGIITTVAGGGSPTYPGIGDMGPATNAEINGPDSVVVNATGNLFISDSGNNRIREVDTNGIITTTCGGSIGIGGSPTNAILFDPAGVGVNASGNLFISDSGNNLIREVDAKDIITTVAGGGSNDPGDGGLATNAILNSPQGVAVDTSGNLFISDSGNDLIRKVDTNGIITTVAGGGSPIYPSIGDGGPATNAIIGQPQGVAVDTSGNLFIADLDDNVIRRVDTNGIIMTVAGNGSQGYSGDGGPATNAELGQIFGVAVDTSGNLFIADTSRIREIDTNGIITTVAGGGSNYPGDGDAATNAMLGLATGVAVDTTGNLFIADTGNQVIREVGTDGIITTVAGSEFNGNYSGDGGSPTNATLFNPGGVAVDATEKLFIADSGNNRIREVTSGPTLTLATVGLNNAGNYDVVVSGPYGSVTSSVVNVAIAIQITPAGLPYGTNNTAYNQQLSATYGQPPYIWSLADVSLPPGLTLANNGLISGTPTTNGTFNFTVQVTDAASSTATQPFTLTVFGPPNVAIIQPTNDLVAIASGNNVNLAVSVAGFGPFSYQWQLNGTNLPNGVITTVAGNGNYGYSGDGGAATNSELAYPDGVAVDATGNIYLADGNNAVIREVSTNGVITTVAGNGNYGYSGDGGAATNAELSSLPSGVAVDAAGNLYIADSINSVIREVGVNGIITTVAGNGAEGYSGDGGAATNAELDYPYSVAVDAIGNLYIADSNNERVREVGTNGIITTVAGDSNWGYYGDGGAATNAGLNYPLGVAVDTSGNLYIADSGNQVIRKVSINGIITTVAGNGFTTNISESWYGGYSGDGGAATNAEFNYPSDVAVDAAGNLYIADSGLSFSADPSNDRIRKVSTNGIITTVVGNGSFGYSGDGGVATNAELDLPWGVVTDASGNLFIADTDNNVIRKVVVLGPTLVLNDVNFTNGGAYDVVVSSPYGSVTSGVVNVTITLSSIVLSAPQISVRNNNFAFTLSGPVGSNYVLQVSTNLVNWSPVSTSTIPVSGTITLTNAISGYNNRFYRTYLQ